MKGLLKYLAPFAPDQSGAAAVFYDMDCITVVCDAGGCIGNYCGFDEPRWFGHKSPIFSAGLRDMDAILGRDDKMVAKLKLVSDKFNSKFAALIGTPVPAVIGTDYRALKKMASKRCGIPVLGVECSGTKLYDEGESDAYLELFRNFSGDGKTEDISKDLHENERILGIIGATPLELTDVDADKKLRDHYLSRGYTKVFCYGMGDGFDEVCMAGKAAKNIVLSPAGIKAAEYLKETFGTPYEAEYMILGDDIKDEARKKLLAAKASKKAGADDEGTIKILVIHQQVIADAMRIFIEEEAGEAEVSNATFFMMDRSLARPGDVHIESEEELRKLVFEGGFDIVAADDILRKAVRGYEGEWISFPHFAVSGDIER